MIDYPKYSHFRVATLAVAMAIIAGCSKQTSTTSLRDIQTIPTLPSCSSIDPATNTWTVIDPPTNTRTVAPTPPPDGDHIVVNNKFVLCTEEEEEELAYFLIPKEMTSHWEEKIDRQVKLSLVQISNDKELLCGRWVDLRSHLFGSHNIRFVFKGPKYTDITYCNAWRIGDCKCKLKDRGNDILEAFHAGRAHGQN